MRIKNLWSLIGLLVIVVMVISACQPQQPAAPEATEPPAPVETAPPPPPVEEVAGFQIPEIEDGKFNVAMVLIGPHDDGGWSQAHFEGLEYLEQNVPNTHTAYIENVPEGADSEQVFRSLARKCFNLILALLSATWIRWRPSRGNFQMPSSSTSAVTSRTPQTSVTCSAPWRT